MPTTTEIPTIETLREMEQTETEISSVSLQQVGSD